MVDDINVWAGLSASKTGGTISMRSGYGTAMSSGSILIRTLNAGTVGVSGELMFSTGTASSWFIWINIHRYWYGTASGGDGGDIMINVGDGNTLDGGHIHLFAGKTDANVDSTGGSISIRSGFSTIRSSGTIIIRTLNAGTTGVSGELMFSTGTTSSGASGSISIGTGTTSGGESGGMYITVGTTKSDDKGGDIHLHAGKTEGDADGGTIEVIAGDTTGGDGDGGDIKVWAGLSASKTGGTISMRSGYGTAMSSGSILIRTLNAGTVGVSGELMFSTGTASSGSSGSISIGTGTASNGDGGDIMINVGDGNTLDGGHIHLFAGKTDADVDSTGGSISIRSGFSTIRSSGTIIIRTLNAGTTGVSGELMFSTGTTSSGASGSISIGTGTTSGGESGGMYITVGTTKSDDKGGDIHLHAGKTERRC